MGRRMRRYRCPDCDKVVYRPGRKRRIRSWCEATDNFTTLRRLWL